MASRNMVVKAYVDVALFQTVHYQAHVERMTASEFIALAIREALERRGVQAKTLMQILEGQRELEVVGGE